MDFLAEDFKDFLANVEEGDLKSEYLLPNIVDKLLKEERANVSFCGIDTRWGLCGEALGVESECGQCNLIWKN